MLVLSLAVAVVGLRGLAPATAQTGSADGFTNFETEPVRPLALAPDGSRLFAVNTADDRLEVFDVGAEGLSRRGEVVVGLRPVAVAARSANEAWVVNHLSDSVSVVDASDPARPRVVRTIQVGDEPRDIVIAGPGRDKVLVATARREELATPGVGRGAVWVLDADDPAAEPTILTVFGTKLRGLAVAPDGRTAYAAVFKSGNRTTTVGEHETSRVAATLVPPIGLTATPPATGRIVQRQGAQWLDDEGGDWSRAVPFELPDQDVFVLDVSGDVPAVVSAVAGVGTVLFNLAVQPGSGEVWVSNQEANNLIRFEPRLRGRAVDQRITRLVPNGDGYDVEPVRLNPHLDQSVVPERVVDWAYSLAQPLDIAFRSDGQRAYVAAFQSRRVAVLDGAGRVLDRIDVGFGPGGLALDEANGRLIVLNHLDASLSVVDLAAGQVTATLPLAYDPTPDVIRDGRPFLYDARLTSATGDQSCAGCHVFGDMDGLAWDLGDPNGSVEAMPFELTHDNFLLKPQSFAFHPLKGPMVTQSFRGLAGTGPLHWRGDRFGSAGRRDDSLAGFARFNGAFVTLNGRSTELPSDDMDRLGRFVLTIRYPPNPLQNLDRSLTPAQQRGLDLYDGPHPIDSGVVNCAGCHTLPTGTNGRINFEGEAVSQGFKAPHLRNLYEKVGRFDVSGPQVSGFGFTHDGAFDTLDRFLQSDVFDFPAATEPEATRMRADVAAFLLAFDTGLAPAVGRQVTVGGASPGGGGELPEADAELLDLLVARATAGDCDLVAHGWRGAVERGWLLASGAFQADRAGEAPLSLSGLLAQAAELGQATTFTCVPPGDGVRSALDRDLDGHYTGDERDAGSDPADPASVPGQATPTPTSALATATTTPSAVFTMEVPSPTSTPARPFFVVWLPAASR